VSGTHDVLTYTSTTKEKVSGLREGQTDTIRCTMALGSLTLRSCRSAMAASLFSSTYTAHPMKAVLNDCRLVTCLCHRLANSRKPHQSMRPYSLQPGLTLIPSREAMPCVGVPPSMGQQSSCREDRLLLCSGLPHCPPQTYPHIQTTHEALPHLNFKRSEA
jgi:hypothetical protein